MSTFDDLLGMIKPSKFMKWNIPPVQKSKQINQIYYNYKNNVNSNHPHTIIRQIPSMIKKGPTNTKVVKNY